LGASLGANLGSWIHDWGHDCGLDRNSFISLFSHSFFRNGRSLPAKYELAEADEVVQGYLFGENVAEL
jgi:hypothetical protein